MMPHAELSTGYDCPGKRAAGLRTVPAMLDIGGKP